MGNYSPNYKSAYHPLRGLRGAYKYSSSWVPSRVFFGGVVLRMP